MTAALWVAGCVGAEPPEPHATPDAGAPLDTWIAEAIPALVDGPITARLASTGGTGFECRVDEAAFAPCEAEVVLDLGLGPHAFEARAVDGSRADETPASAQVTFVQDLAHPNLAIVEAGPGWTDLDADRPGLLDASWPSQLVPFYDLYPDDYMSVVSWADFLATSSGGVPFASPLRNDIGGIGAEWYWRQPPGVGDRTAEAGSDGALEVAIWMNGRAYWDAFDWLDIWWDGKVQDVLAQEFGHRWGAYARLPDRAESDALLDDWGAHWDFYVGLDGPSPMGWWLEPVEDHGDGTFTSWLWTEPTEYASLDLYAMGLLPAEEVPDFFWVRDAAPSLTAEFLTRGRWDFTGERVDVTMDEIVEAQGPRDPAFGEAPTSFRQAFVIFVRPGEWPSEDTLDWLDGVRRDWETFFHDATRGLGTVDTALFDTTRETEVTP